MAYLDRNRAPVATSPTQTAEVPPSPAQGQTFNGLPLATVIPNKAPAAASPADAAAIPGQIATGATVGVSANGNRSVSGPYGSGSATSAANLSPERLAASGVYENGQQVTHNGLQVAKVLPNAPATAPKPAVAAVSPAEESNQIGRAHV